MNILSCFDGMSCGRIALDRAGIKVDKYYASEIDKYAIKVTQKNYPDTIQLGDIENWREWGLDNIDIVIGGSPCFVAGTMVLTIDGYKPIENIIVGDWVYTHKKRYKRVISVGKNNNKPIYKLKSQGMLETKVTANHPYYARKLTKTWNNVKKKYDKIISDANWIAVEDLNVGDYLGIPIIKESDNPNNLTEDECWMLGRYVADGHIRHDKRNARKNSWQYGVVFSIGNNKIEYFLEKLKSFSITHYHHTQSCHRALINSKKWVEFIEKYNFGKHAIEKNIPNVILNLPKCLLAKFLEGYFSGDGSKRDSEWRATTISKNLSLGLCVAIAKTYNKGASVEYYVRPKTTVIENRIVNQHDTYAVSYKNENSIPRFFEENGYMWFPIKIVESLNENATVYNIEVEDDNSYTANNFIVHNCQGFSNSGKGLNFEDPRSKLFFTFVEIINYYKPKYFLLENVKMKKEWENVITEHIKVSPILIDSALVSGQSRKRLYWTNIENVSQPEDKHIYLKDIIESGSVDRDKSYCIDACYYKGGSLKQYAEKKRRQIDNLPAATRESERRLMVEENKCIQVGEAEEINGYDIVKRVYSTDGKSPTLTSMSGGHRQPKIALDEKYWRKLTPLECERLQTVPDNYTACVSNTQRYKMLGNGWTVDVIAHIFSHLPEGYKNSDL